MESYSYKGQRSASLSSTMPIRSTITRQGTSVSKPSIGLPRQETVVETLEKKQRENLNTRLKLLQPILPSKNSLASTMPVIAKQPQRGLSLPKISSRPQHYQSVLRTSIDLDSSDGQQPVVRRNAYGGMSRTLGMQKSMSLSDVSFDDGGNWGTQTLGNNFRLNSTIGISKGLADYARKSESFDAEEDRIRPNNSFDDDLLPLQTTHSDRVEEMKKKDSIGRDTNVRTNGIKKGNDFDDDVFGLHSSKGELGHEKNRNFASRIEENGLLNKTITLDNRSKNVSNGHHKSNDQNDRIVSPPPVWKQKSEEEVLIDFNTSGEVEELWGSGLKSGGNGRVSEPANGIDGDFPSRPSSSSGLSAISDVEKLTVMEEFKDIKIPPNKAAHIETKIFSDKKSDDEEQKFDTKIFPNKGSDDEYKIETKIFSDKASDEDQKFETEIFSDKKSDDEEQKVGTKILLNKESDDEHKIETVPAAWRNKEEIERSKSDDIESTQERNGKDFAMKIKDEKFLTTDVRPDKETTAIFKSDAEPKLEDDLFAQLPRRHSEEHVEGKGEVITRTQEPAEDKQKDKIVVTSSKDDGAVKRSSAGDSSPGEMLDKPKTDSVTPFQVEINKLPEIGLGFCIDGGKGYHGDGPIKVKRIFPGFETHLEVGDEILKAADQDMTDMSHLQAWKFLKSLPDGPIKMTIVRRNSSEKI